MSLKDYLSKKELVNSKIHVKIECDNFLEQVGYAIYSLDFKRNHVFVENFLVDKESNDINPEIEANYLNKLRFKEILDDKDILQLQENFSNYCKKQAEKAKSYLEFLLQNYNNMDVGLELVFNEKIFPEYQLSINFNDKKYITSYRLNEVKNIFDKHLEQSNIKKLYKNHSVFYGFTNTENKKIIEEYIKKISWNLPLEIPSSVALATNLDEVKEKCSESSIVEIKASIDDVFICGKDIHIINENFIPQRIKWIKI